MAMPADSDHTGTTRTAKHSLAIYIYTSKFTDIKFNLPSAIIMAEVKLLEALLPRAKKSWQEAQTVAIQRPHVKRNGEDTGNVSVASVADSASEVVQSNPGHRVVFYAVELVFDLTVSTSQVADGLQVLMNGASVQVFDLCTVKHKRCLPCVL